MPVIAKLARCFFLAEQLVVIANRDKAVKIWDANNGKELHTLKGHTGSVRSVSYSPDGQRIASGSYDTRLKIWDASE